MIGRYIPLRNSLKSILEIPDWLNEIKKYIQDLNADNANLSNVIQESI